MARRAKFQNKLNHIRQLEYKKVGIVMLPTKKEEALAIQAGAYEVVSKTK